MVTAPVLDIVTTLVLDDVHGVVGSAVPEPVNVTELPPTQALNVPLIVGNALTVNVAVWVQLFVLRYVIVVVPAPTAVTTPVLETVATAVLDDVQGVVA